MSLNELDLVILKTLTTNKKYAVEFVNDCDTKLFAPEVWNFANHIIAYIKTYKELPTLRVLTDKLAKNPSLVENIKTIWGQLDNIKYDDKEYKYDLDKLKKRFAEKQLSKYKDTFIQLDNGDGDVNKVVNDLQTTIKSIRSLHSAQTYESKNIKDYLPIFVDKFNARKNNPDLEAGLMTKYAFIDFATNGLKSADFLLIAGESGFGKSLFLQNIAVQVWQQNNIILNNFSFKPGKNIIYFSLEMPYEDCFNRLLSRLSGVASRDIENAELSRDDFNKVKEALDFIKNYPYEFKIVDIANASANDLEAILVNQDIKYDAVFVDYLGIMKPNDNTIEDADWLKQGIISQEVRSIARKYELPIFSAVQLNRKGTSKDPSESIGLNRLARSATIATHATHVIQIENRNNEEQHYDFLYHLIKNRKGPKGKSILIKNLACAILIDKEGATEELNNIEETNKNYDEYFPNSDDISGELEDLEL